jgi:hypothetical protein
MKTFQEIKAQYRAEIKPIKESSIKFIEERIIVGFKRSLHYVDFEVIPQESLTTAKVGVNLVYEDANTLVDQLKKLGYNRISRDGCRVRIIIEEI